MSAAKSRAESVTRQSQMVNGGLESLVKGSGHTDTIKVIKSRPDMVLKAFNEPECKALEELSRHPRLAHFAPSYFGKHTVDDKIFIVMSNLLFGTTAPHSMDIKIGLRTFQEDEVANDKTRMDLLKKMMDIDPMEPTEDEKTLGITKLRYYTVEYEEILQYSMPVQEFIHSLIYTYICIYYMYHRYMQFRESKSSSKLFGFRIEAVSVPLEEGESLTQAQTKRFQTKDDVIVAFRLFLRGRRAAHEQLLTRLCLLRRELQASAWFQHHEMVSTSLLLYRPLKPISP